MSRRISDLVTVKLRVSPRQPNSRAECVRLLHTASGVSAFNKRNRNEGRAKARNVRIFRRGNGRIGSKWFKRWRMLMLAQAIRLEVAGASGTGREALSRATEWSGWRG